MTIDKALVIGKAGNEISKTITGTDEVSAGRTVVAAGSGAALGAAAAGTVTVAATAVGATIAAPVVVPLAVAGAAIAGIMSLFD